jgi:GNAT superfamily N-acetyltransferase
VSDSPWIRPARAGEGEALTDLAVRSKAHWGYDTVFLAAARMHLTVGEDAIAAGRVYVLEGPAGVIGFHGFLGDPPEGTLEWLFVEPGVIGRGYGRRMWNDAIDRARSAGFRRLVIESDRFAEPFYVAMGANRFDERPSPVDSAPLPLLDVKL